MIRQEVKSSTLKSIGYDATSGVLEVEFNNSAIYRFSDVPCSKYKDLLQAASKGKYFNKHIKHKHEFSCVGFIKNKY